jgi:broad specificity phosphatase PhoE
LQSQALATQRIRLTFICFTDRNKFLATIYLVRHGKASSGFDSHLDPGLDELGRTQATAAADDLAPLGPLPIFSSPLAWAQQTAAPLAERWGVTPVIENRVAEIPSPTEDLSQRAEWLRGVMADCWSNLDPGLHRWRQAMIACVSSYAEDCVVFCHFVAINVLVGASTGADEMTTFRPDNGSVTTICTESGRLHLIELGREADTRVN